MSILRVAGMCPETVGWRQIKANLTTTGRLRRL
jgi:hypothetical protein